MLASPNFTSALSSCSSSSNSDLQAGHGVSVQAGQGGVHGAALPFGASRLVPIDTLFTLCSDSAAASHAFNRARRLF